MGFSLVPNLAVFAGIEEKISPDLASFNISFILLPAKKKVKLG